jgi:5-methylthioadenosine/S-adenosylhomocysteine deaminase
MSTILIKNADWLVTMDAERRIITDGALLIENDRVVKVGKTSALKRTKADAVIDAGGKLVLPGLIDTHVHNTQQLGRGLADGCDIPLHLLERLYRYEAELMEEDAYWAAICCQLELIRAGTTCFVDPGNYFPHKITEAMGVSGLRGVVARIAFDVHSTPMGDVSSKAVRESTAEAVANAEKAFKALRGMHDGRVRPWFALRVLAVCSDDLIRAIKAKADEYGVGLVLHASEARDEVVASRVKFGMPDVERMAALGVLGPNVLLIHMGWASPKELVLCMRHDLKVSCTPSTGYRLGLGSIEFGRFPEMLELGVTVALGSDSAMSSNYLDIVREMFLVSGGCKAQRLDPTVLPPETALEMATVNGAKAALWSDEIGALEIGKKADVAIFDMQSPEWQPVLNPIANLVYAARGGADTVLCDGRVLMRDKVVISIDEKRALKEAKERGARIAERAGLRDRIRPTWPIV